MNEGINDRTKERTNACAVSPLSQVYFWRDSSQLRWLSVSRAMKSKAFPPSGSRRSGALPGLIPYSNYKMYIVVANNRYEGPPSNTIEFSTPEGSKEKRCGAELDVADTFSVMVLFLIMYFPVFILILDL